MADYMLVGEVSDCIADHMWGKGKYTAYQATCYGGRKEVRKWMAWKTRGAAWQTTCGKKKDTAWQNTCGREIEEGAYMLDTSNGEGEALHLRHKWWERRGTASRVGHSVLFRLVCYVLFRYKKRMFRYFPFFS